jgi:hypothetical protein
MSVKMAIIDGTVNSKDGFKQSDVIVRFISTKQGETLGLQANDVEITVPFEKLKPIMEEARKPNERR